MDCLQCFNYPLGSERETRGGDAFSPLQRRAKVNHGFALVYFFYVGYSELYTACKTVATVLSLRD